MSAWNKSNLFLYEMTNLTSNLSSLITCCWLLKHKKILQPKSRLLLLSRFWLYDFIQSKCSSQSEWPAQKKVQRIWIPLRMDLKQPQNPSFIKKNLFKFFYLVASSGLYFITYFFDEVDKHQLGCIKMVLDPFPY